MTSKLKEEDRGEGRRTDDGDAAGTNGFGAGPHVAPLHLLRRHEVEDGAIVPNIEGRRLGEGVGGHVGADELHLCGGLRADSAFVLLDGGRGDVEDGDGSSSVVQKQASEVCVSCAHVDDGESIEPSRSY